METENSHSEQHSSIQTAAYYLWEQRGCPMGTPDTDWFRAESQLHEHGGRKSAFTAVAETVGAALGTVAGLVASAGS